MFKGAVAFNKELAGTSPAWDLSAVTTMEGMFEGATKFNNDDKDTMKTWITSAVTNMASMFKGAADFNLDLTQAGGKWDTADVIQVFMVSWPPLLNAVAPSNMPSMVVTADKS